MNFVCIYAFNYVGNNEEGQREWWHSVLCHLANRPLETHGIGLPPPPHPWYVFTFKDSNIYWPISIENHFNFRKDWFCHKKGERCHNDGIIIHSFLIHIYIILEIILRFDFIEPKLLFFNKTSNCVVPAYILGKQIDKVFL